MLVLVVSLKDIKIIHVSTHWHSAFHTCFVIQSFHQCFLVVKWNHILSVEYLHLIKILVKISNLKCSLAWQTAFHLLWEAWTVGKCQCSLILSKQVTDFFHHQLVLVSWWGPMAMGCPLNFPSDSNGEESCFSHMAALIN